MAIPQHTLFNPCSYPTDHCDHVATEITCILMRLYDVIPADLNMTTTRSMFVLEVEILFRMFCAMRGLPSDHATLYRMLDREFLVGDILKGIGSTSHVDFPQRWADDALLCSFGVKTVLRAEILVIFIRVVIVGLIFAHWNSTANRAMTPIWDGSRMIPMFSPEYAYENYKTKLLSAVFRFLSAFKLFVLSDEVDLTEFPRELISSFINLCDFAPRGTQAYLGLMACFAEGTKAHTQLGRASNNFGHCDHVLKHRMDFIGYAGYMFNAATMTDWRGIRQHRRQVLGRMVGISSLIFTGSLPRCAMFALPSTNADELDDEDEQEIDEGYPTTWFGPNRANRSKFPRLQHQTSVGQKSD